RWHPGTNHRQTLPRDQSHRHRRAGPHDCGWLALHEDRGRAPHAPGPANDLGTEPREAVNYFNYYTEIEEHFQRVRGTSLFLLSPLDWAMIETWNESGVPLEAVLRGIDAAFEKWRSRKVKTRMVNSLAFCAQAVLTEAQIMAGLTQPKRETAPAVPLDDLRAYLESNAAAVPYPEIADSLRRMAAEIEAHYKDLES